MLILKVLFIADVFKCIFINPKCNVNGDNWKHRGVQQCI